MVIYLHKVKYWREVKRLRIGIIEDFDGTSSKEQEKKIIEEAVELLEAVHFSEIENIESEGADVIQTIFTLWHNLGILKTREDFKRIMEKHYLKEVSRGRKVSFL